MADIQYCITVMGGREVSRPYRVWFFAEGERFLSFCRCHRPQEVGVGDVVWLIQAPAWNQTCRSTNDRCEALASAKGCFLCFCFCAPCIYPLIRNRFSVQSVESVWGFFMIYTHSRKALDISIQRLVAHRGVEPLLQEWKSWVLADIRMRHSLATQRELKSQRLSVVT